MNQKHYLIKGTLLLTIMGLLTRIAGFFYKIFLSRTIGASEIGLYQVALPVLSFCSALCGGGVQTAISKLTAKYLAERRQQEARLALIAGLLLSLFLSFFLTLGLYFGARLIAGRLLLEESCEGLLKIMTFSLPFNMIHGCVCGYFIGAKHIVPPALSQFIEQLIRIFFVVLAYTLSLNSNRPADARLMAFGALAGEAASAIFCMISLYVLCIKKTHMDGRAPAPVLFSDQRLNSSVREKFFCHRLTLSVRQLLSISLPLSMNRMLMCILQAIEAALLPQMLRLSGLTPVEALSVYGTLTGMALPLLLFPTAITSALGMLLLPAVSEAQALQKHNQLSHTANAAFLGGLLLGSFCLGGFLLFGNEIGSILFQSELAGVCIRRLALICPLIYISTTLTSILHGLGKTSSLLLWNLAGFALRLLGVLRLVPAYGINGYLCGMLLDQILLTGCILFFLHQKRLLTISIPHALTRFLLPAASAGGSAFLFLILSEQKIPARIGLITGGGIYCVFFFTQRGPSFHRFLCF